MADIEKELEAIQISLDKIATEIQKISLVVGKLSPRGYHTRSSGL
jgi:hypothetical protein